MNNADVIAGEAKQSSNKTCMLDCFTARVSPFAMTAVELKVES
jgi:hypothetical protein